MPPAPALAVAPVCEACGGKRFVLGAQGGMQPCAACQPWRQRPDFRPASPLLTLQDLDLAALDSGSSGDGSGSSGEEGGAPARRRRRPTGPMSAERREAISRSLKSKGAKSEEHKR